MTILDTIKPIKLLSGSHKDTGTTGQGCAMNVIAYLNGEAQITDSSSCVCVTIRKPLIWFNDFLRDDERQALVPYLLRAMGSATDDKTVMKRRLDLLVTFAQQMASYASYAANAVSYAVSYASYAANAAAYAVSYAANAANANREALKKIAFEFLDAALPPAEIPSREVLARAEKLAELATA
jgi:hypothetical protein